MRFAILTLALVFSVSTHAGKLAVLERYVYLEGEQAPRGVRCTVYEIHNGSPYILMAEKELAQYGNYYKFETVFYEVNYGIPRMVSELSGSTSSSETNANASRLYLLTIFSGGNEMVVAGEGKTIIKNSSPEIAAALGEKVETVCKKN